MRPDSDPPAGPVNRSPLLTARICHDDGQTARR